MSRLWRKDCVRVFYDSQHRLAVMVVIISGGVVPWWLSCERDNVSVHLSLMSETRHAQLLAVQASTYSSRCDVATNSWRQWDSQSGLYATLCTMSAHTHTHRHNAMTMYRGHVQDALLLTSTLLTVVSRHGGRSATDRQADTPLSLLSRCYAATLAVNMSTYNSEGRRSSLTLVSQWLLTYCSFFFTTLLVFLGSRFSFLSCTCHWAIGKTGNNLQQILLHINRKHFRKDS